MIPGDLQTLFWGANLDTFIHEAYPDYTIYRVLEYGDQAAIEPHFLDALPGYLLPGEVNHNRARIAPLVGKLRALSRFQSVS